MTKLTTEQVRAELERIVQEKGADYVYSHVVGRDEFGGFTECFYADPETEGPSCLVGHVFASLIPPLFEELRRHEETWGYSRAVGELGGTSAGRLIQEYLTPEAVEGLALAQAAQDVGQSWGVALRQFSAGVKSYREDHGWRTGGKHED